MNNFQGKDVISVRDFSRSDLEHLFQTTQEVREELKGKKSLSLLKGYILCSLFYEVSTRTRFSYETAMITMGGGTISASEAQKQTSAAKGETLGDAIRVIEQYADIVVLRHPQLEAAKEAAKYGRKPLINGGDGSGEHPTQAFSDIYTIFEERKRLDGLNITILGDLKYSRAIHSVALGLAKFDSHINFVSPKGLELPAEIKKAFGQKSFRETHQLNDVVKDSDVIYMTRTQLERFSTPEERNEFLAIKDQYCLTRRILDHAKHGITIMHPGPRIGGEITEDLDDYEGFAYFREVENAIYNRMALLGLIFGKL